MRVKLTLMLWALALAVSAQQTESNFKKFGKIKTEHLQKKSYSLDSSASAVVLSDVGEAAIVGNSKSSFSISFTRHRVVHILNKNGYHEADVEIPLYTSGGAEEKLLKIKAVTYNLENGKVEETKLDKGSIFKEERTKNLLIRKFTMPNVKEGCIIEYEYEVSSDFISNLDPWVFQGLSPVLWSEFSLSVPEFFTYAFLSHGYHPMFINEKNDRQESFSVSETRGTGATDRMTFTAGVTTYRWAMRDIPELKEESFTSAIKNHLSSLEFQLASQNYPLTFRNFRNSWTALTKELLESEGFGLALSKDNNWLRDEVRPLLVGVNSDKEKAFRIYRFIQNEFNCTDNTPGSIWTSQTIKNVFKSRKGNVADLNLLLASMLRFADLEANPVILSTTHHGYALESYPMITSFNYVITQFVNEDDVYYLDASVPGLGFGKLMPECFNGHARVVNERATPLTLSANSLLERKITAVFIANDSTGKWIGSINQTPGYYESYSIRNKIRSKGESEFFKEVEKRFGIDLEIEKPRIDSLRYFEQPVALKYDLKFKPIEEPIIYFNPMFGEGYKTNPFKSAIRHYPVEMPYTIDETFLLTMEVPAGYAVDELPKQMLAKFDEEGKTFFEYRLSLSGSTISLRSRIKIARTIFLPEEYPTLREFFNLIVKKQGEQIVFKKKETL